MFTISRILFLMLSFLPHGDKTQTIQNLRPDISQKQWIYYTRSFMTTYMLNHTCNHGHLSSPPPLPPLKPHYKVPSPQPFWSS